MKGQNYYLPQFPQLHNPEAPISYLLCELASAATTKWTPKRGLCPKFPPFLPSSPSLRRSRPASWGRKRAQAGRWAPSLQQLLTQLMFPPEQEGQAVKQLVSNSLITTSANRVEVSGVMQSLRTCNVQGLCCGGTRCCETQSIGDKFRISPAHPKAKLRDPRCVRPTLLTPSTPRCPAPSGAAHRPWRLLLQSQVLETREDLGL